MNTLPLRSRKKKNWFAVRSSKIPPSWWDLISDKNLNYLNEKNIWWPKLKTSSVKQTEEKKKQIETNESSHKHPNEQEISAKQDCASPGTPVKHQQ